jgi:O-succinylbenzoate synthase
MFTHLTILQSSSSSSPIIQLYCPSVAFGLKGSLKKHIDAVHLKLREHACPYCKGDAFWEKGTPMQCT